MTGLRLFFLLTETVLKANCDRNEQILEQEQAVKENRDFPRSFVNKDQESMN